MVDHFTTHTHRLDSTQTVMRAIGLTEFPEIGKVADYLKMLDVPVPTPKKGEVIIKQAASSMHIDEIYAAQGTALGKFYGPKTVSEDNPFIIGSSVSGTIVAIGQGVTKFKIGDDVIAIPSHHMEIASWAEYRSLREAWIMLKPDEFTHVEAAATTMAACVAWGAVGSAGIKAGDQCVVVGASGAIGVMVMQFLKSMDCYVVAVCSGASEKFVCRCGADEVVDYTAQGFGDVAILKGVKYDAVFDCVGGHEIEANAFKSLKKTGSFVTVVGPMQYIGEKKLSWPAFIKVMGYIVWRMLMTRIMGGPRYTFGEKRPNLVIKDAMSHLLKHNIRMPVSKPIPFEIEAVANAVRSLTTHREKGRIVIDFSLPRF